MEKLRKEALVLQEKKDFLAMSVDLLRNNEYLTGLDESEYQAPYLVGRPNWGRVFLEVEKWCSRSKRSVKR